VDARTGNPRAVRRGKVSLARYPFLGRGRRYVGSSVARKSPAGAAGLSKSLPYDLCSCLCAEITPRSRETFPKFRRSLFSIALHQQCGDERTLNQALSIQLAHETFEPFFLFEVDRFRRPPASQVQRARWSFRFHCRFGSLPTWLVGALGTTPATQ
jgi:hypothetical protein